MPDKFPEAFRRFEKQVDTKNIKNFEQLKLSFENWNIRPYGLTQKQTHALGVEAQKRGISPVMRVHVSYVRETKSGSRRIDFVAWRNVRTGRWSKAP